MRTILSILLLSSFPAIAAVTIVDLNLDGAVDSDFETDTFVSREELVADQWFRSNRASASFEAGRLVTTSNTDGFRGASYIFDASSLATGTYTLSYEIVGISVNSGQPLQSDGGAQVVVSQAQGFDGFELANANNEGIIFRTLTSMFELGSNSSATVFSETPNGLQQSTGVFSITFDFQAPPTGSSALSFGFGAVRGSRGAPLDVTFDNIFLAPVIRPPGGGTGAIPEVSTSLLVAVGTIGFGLCYRRRSAKN